MVIMASITPESLKFIARTLEIMTDFVYRSQWFQNAIRAICYQFMAYLKRDLIGK